MTMINPETDLLLVIDPQNDFEGGSLPVPGASRIWDKINKIAAPFKYIGFSRDRHNKGQISFASNHEGAAPFTMIDVSYGQQMLWPDHCQPGTWGYEFVKEIQALADRATFIVSKGYTDEVDSYSAFFDNDHKSSTGLADLLRGLGIKRIFVCGLALDYCVRFSAEDGKKEGFTVTVITDASAAITPEGASAARESFIALGISECDSSQISGII